ncbi:MAG: ATP-dependent DNA helicase RecG, partial [Deltaproteobacteria bacterium]|nr:ATP-dependent DNA helicase RecG [Deltaproteobacteria bacterium]
LAETIPAGLLEQLRLPDLRTSIRHLHRPTDDDELTALAEGRSCYHQRLAFDEFFHLQVALAQRRTSRRANPALPVPRPPDPQALAGAILPFEPTAAQRRVIDEIVADLTGPQPMARLLQGDVGSGKTAVAAVAALAAARAGLQVAFLAPTEILAEQHRRTLAGLMPRAGIEVGALTGSTRARDRRQMLARLASGELPLVVGTHALLQPDVVFSRLGLVVVDEQHRFGVLQRAALAERGPLIGDGLRAVPHQLVMTATPIPRSLTLTLYGDLALSVLDELPPGRTPIATAVLRQEEGDRFYREIATELATGGRIFVVYPLVEESEKLDLANATSGAEALRHRFPEAGVTLLTGRMKGAEKEAAMAAFASGRSRVLVATTVVEVGIDVPQASGMVVVNAERFGLSQLHQLRGRVGRGARASRCLLVHGGAGGVEAWRRLKVMEQTNDGFRIAEEDLAIRGPGDLLGTRQAGLPSFAFADLMRHGRLLEEARRAAQAVVERDPGLALPEHAALQRALAEQYRTRLALLRGG